ncbi:alcohol dehydrogenase catalytic domain-containing protein [Pseudarthrobacter phenanthrenivorans]|uniref:alcohol dehydrogenase catalytic domain-containing protein n=1 Tax=Pseudarthrobacter phenanthrenivorans TaxID=361575 RepID=UPI00344F9B29
MKAWQFTHVNHPIELVELPEPTPRQGEVVVDIRAAGLCHSDVGMLEGELPGLPVTMPIVLGHEIAGIVAAVGSDVARYRVGDRVAVLPLPSDMQGAAGIGRNGGYAEKTVVHESFVIPIAEGLDFAQAAAGTDAGATSYRAVMTRGRVSTGMRVGIIGLGGLGMTGARIAVLAGAEVYAAEPNSDVHQAALDRGVKEVVSDIAELADRQLEVIIDFAGVSTTGAAVAAAAYGGRIVQVGANRAKAEFMLTDLIQKELEILGSNGMVLDDAVGVFELLNSGQLTLMTSEIAFEDIGEGLERLRRGEVRGRLVAVVSD